ncbi:unnamed protein product [Linum trigynum]|uniref:Uncharacterized protein n=1 Tax=Linum trigynum TaxID=586398 RepID=A0AAV2ET12_9ROSI
MILCFAVRGQRVSITLWNELTAVLDRPALIQADSIEPVIVGVGGAHAGEYSCSSSSGTRIVISPRIPGAYSLAAFFGGSRVPVADLPVKFATPGDAVADAERRTRTIAELLDLHHGGASVDEKHRCGGIVRSVESRSPCYKIQLTLRDATDEAPFIIFGPCGNNLVLTSAQLLAQRYPHRSGQLPPELEALLGQFVRFEVKLPMVGSSGVSTGEFCVFRVMPRDVQGPVLGLTGVPDVTGSVSSSQTLSQSYSGQEGMLMLPAPGVPFAASASAAIPSSSSKGKEKVVDSVSPGGTNPTFQIGQVAGLPLSSSQVHLAIKENVVVSDVISPNLLPPVSSIAPLLSVADVKGKGTGPGATVVAAPFTIADPLKVSNIQSVGAVKGAMGTPGTLSDGMDVMSSTSQGVHGLSSIAGLGSETPQSKISKSSSAVSPLSSRSLLISPLAKVKIEKLESSGTGSPNVRQDDEQTESSSPFSLADQDSHRAPGKPSTAKRRLYES